MTSQPAPEPTPQPMAEPARPQTSGPMRVRELAIYPVKGEPGASLETVQVELDGLAGDRRKKQPVHIVGSGETPETTRANVFVDAEADEVLTLLGQTVRIGTASLLVTQLPSGCVGVYATVAHEGLVRVGDVLEPEL